MSLWKYAFCVDVGGQSCERLADAVKGCGERPDKIASADSRQSELRWPWGRGGL